MVTLAELSALQFTMPIFVVIMAVAVLGERVDLPRIGVVAAGFAGTLIIVRPTGLGVGIGPLAVLAAAFFYASAFIATKRLSSSETGKCRGVLYERLRAGVFGDPGGVRLAHPRPRRSAGDRRPRRRGLRHPLLRHQAMAAADASFVVPFDFLRLPLSAGLGIVLFGEAFDMRS